MPSQPAALIYESLVEQKVDVYNNPLVNELMQENKEAVFFHLDSFSEAAMFDYAKTFISSSDQVLFIVLFEGDGESKGLAPILQGAMRHGSKITLYADKKNELQSKVANRFDYQLFENRKDLEKAAKNWIQSR
jgi:hypothetical protein